MLIYLDVGAIGIGFQCGWIQLTSLRHDASFVQKSPVSWEEVMGRYDG